MNKASNSTQYPIPEAPQHDTGAAFVLTFQIGLYAPAGLYFAHVDPLRIESIVSLDELHMASGEVYPLDMFQRYKHGRYVGDRLATVMLYVST